MVQTKKFRGVRQRHWGSWVAEIRHPLFTIDTSESKTDISASASSSLSSILSAKLRKCCKSPSPSLTCLRLDTTSSHIGVWQKRAGSKSDSSWAMTVELGPAGPSHEPTRKASLNDVGLATEVGGGEEEGTMDEEEKVALQMIEELLNTN
ncbi:hypothetical protein Bca52824_078976 [Brassica carinata]|uniref:AP2/ERF domain-containing protein n=1 Tax=Brassica carinata TaxID=52824 RepID=A0A8X7TYX3_BRACI|nr:hypothetical protein Bca52824_078976 [Brassica carinata]